MKNFAYEAGYVIQVEINVDEFLFINETKKTEQKLKLSITEEKWLEVCSCAQLRCKEDSVLIQ
jgi:hypothetical protein